MKNNSAIHAAVKSLLNADALLITAGAGMGVDSGLPDYRGKNGLWTKYIGKHKGGLDFSSPHCFQVDPYMSWWFFGNRYRLFAGATPHPGFQILLNWCRQKTLDSFVFTSNVDGQFQKAGFPQDRIYECHGSLHYLQCSKRCTEYIWPCKIDELVIDEQQQQAQGPIPRCPSCDAVARPNVMMFYDDAWILERYWAQRQRFLDWQSSVTGRSVTVIELGAGTAIPTIRAESEFFEGDLIRINSHDAFGGNNTIAIRMSALDGLRALDDLIQVA